MNFRHLLPPVLLLSAASAFAADPGPASAAIPDHPLATYASLGSSFAGDTGLAKLGWSEAQFNAFLDGIRATYRGQPYALIEDAGRLRQEVQERLKQASAEVERGQLDFSQPGRVEAYMKEAVKQYKLQLSDSGLAYGINEGGSNFHPGPGDTVVLTCEAVAADRETPLPGLALKEQRAKVADLLPGLNEAVQMMSPRSSALVVLPPDLSFGSGPWPDGVPRGSPILCMLQLHEIVTPP